MIFCLNENLLQLFALLSIPDNSTNLQLVVLAIILASEVFLFQEHPKAKRWDYISLDDVP